MGLKTDVIKYNLKNRGRKYLGSERNFNIGALVRLINSPVTQEMVKNGDMVGYLGHGIRQSYGFNPDEVISNTKDLISIDPAIRTISLKAYEDGSIEHQDEFLDTALGKKAQSWYESKIGGFSSVITPTENNPLMFWGFDYVKTPNYSSNRGYVMDSVTREYHYSQLKQKEKLDYMTALQEEQQAVMDAVLSSGANIQQMNHFLVDGNEQLAQVLDSVSLEKEALARRLIDANHELESLRVPERTFSLTNDNPITRSLSVFDSVEKIRVIPENQISVEPPSMSEMLKRLKR